MKSKQEILDPSATNNNIKKNMRLKIKFDPKIVIVIYKQKNTSNTFRGVCQWLWKNRNSFLFFFEHVSQLITGQGWSHTHSHTDKKTKKKNTSLAYIIRN